MKLNATQPPDVTKLVNASLATWATENWVTLAVVFFAVIIALKIIKIAMKSGGKFAVYAALTGSGGGLGSIVTWATMNYQHYIALAKGLGK
jgi:hypothetical protein